MSDADLVVVGAGILGLAVAREALRRRPGARVTVLERHAQVGAEQTMRNSGVIHAGIYYAPGSLKARLCVEGARELYAYCEERGIAHERCGKVIVALDERELPALDELERRGRANGVPGLRRLDGDGLRALEPAARGDRGAALARTPASSTSPLWPAPTPTTCARPGARSCSAAACRPSGRAWSSTTAARSRRARSSPARAATPIGWPRPAAPRPTRAQCRSAAPT